jgi:uncharacterized protein involved in propanediol utilization
VKSIKKLGRAATNSILKEKNESIANIIKNVFAWGYK